MANRSQLRAQLRAAWKRTIEEHYQNQQINSERGLQAFLCAALLDKFEEDGVARNRRIFVEPTLLLEKPNRTRKPDILICNTCSIIGVVELKYKPKTGPRRSQLSKDLETLQGMAEQPHGIRVQNGQYLGIVRDHKSYTLADDAVLCWAGVHREMGIPVSTEVSLKLHKYFMELHAVTALDADPRIE